MRQIPTIIANAGYITLNGVNIVASIQATFLAGRLGGTIVLNNISWGDLNIPSEGVIDILITYPNGYGVTSSTVGVVSLGKGSDNIEPTGGLIAYAVICGDNTVNIYLSTSIDVLIPEAQTMEINFMLFQVSPVL
jgi:hypothetical protein